MSDMTDRLGTLQTLAEGQESAHRRMVELKGGIGLLAAREPSMYAAMLRWEEATSNDHADTVLPLVTALLGALAEMDAGTYGDPEVPFRMRRAIEEALG